MRTPRRCEVRAFAEPVDSRVGNNLDELLTQNTKQKALACYRPFRKLELQGSPDLYLVN